jgi:hypothetical protein
MNHFRFSRGLALLAVLLFTTLGASAAPRSVRVLCQGEVPAEAYYYDGKESHPLKLARGQFTAPFAYANTRFALFATPPVFDSAGRLQTTPMAYVELPADAPQALVLLAGAPSAYTTLAMPLPSSKGAQTLTLVNLTPVELGVGVDKATLQLAAKTAQSLNLPASDGSKVARYTLRVAGKNGDTWLPLAMSNLTLRTDRSGLLVLRQPSAATGANASSGEKVAWDVVYTPGS